MKLLTRTKLIIALGAVASVAACGAPSASEDAPVPASTVIESVHETTHVESTGTGGESATETVATQRDHLGPVALVADALSKIGLNNEQRGSIEQLGKKVSEKERLVVEARRGLQSALAQQLRSGEIDEADLEDEVEALVSARIDASPVLRKAFEDLHGILDQKQRSALVDAVMERMESQARDAEGWFDEFARDLNLSPEQKTQARDLLDRSKPQLDADRRTVEAVFQAFKEDEFSIEKIVPLEQVGKRTRLRTQGMIAIAKELSAILTPEQRARLAQKIEPKERMRELESQEEPIGQIQQGVIFGGGYRTGVVRSWGGGYGVGRMTVARGGYAAGYPFIGGYGMTVW